MHIGEEGVGLRNPWRIDQPPASASNDHQFFATDLQTMAAEFFHCR
jgi:hypothetical protein